VLTVVNRGALACVIKVFVELQTVSICSIAVLTFVIAGTTICMAVLTFVITVTTFCIAVLTFVVAVTIFCTPVLIYFRGLLNFNLHISRYCGLVAPNTDLMYALASAAT
jgi:hypothetical protein